MSSVPTLISLLKRAQGHLTQNEFAKRCGISSSNLTRIYRGKQQPSPELLKKISEYTQEYPSYADLMAAAGYWKDVGINDKNTSSGNLEDAANEIISRIDLQSSISFLIDDMNDLIEAILKIKNDPKNALDLDTTTDLVTDCQGLLTEIINEMSRYATLENDYRKMLGSQYHCDLDKGTLMHGIYLAHVFKKNRLHLKIDAYEKKVLDLCNTLFIKAHPEIYMEYYDLEESEL